MDGVLVDNRAFHKMAWSRYLQMHCGKTDFDYEGLMQQFFGKTNQKIFEYIYQRPLSANELRQFESEKELLYRELYKNDIAPLKGLLLFLKKLENRKIAMGIGTSGPMDNVAFVTEATGTARYFSAITDANQVQNGKPDPEVYLKTAEKLHVAPEQCVVFEDSISGVQAGINAGMSVVGVCTEHPPRVLADVGAIFSVDDFSAIDLDSLLH